MEAPLPATLGWAKRVRGTRLESWVQVLPEPQAGCVTLHTGPVHSHLETEGPGLGGCSLHSPKMHVEVGSLRGQAWAKSFPLGSLT